MWQWELFSYNGMKKVGAYTSKKLSPTERNWAVWEKDAYTVHWPLLTWRQFLEGSQRPFKVWMDHKNLEALQSPSQLSPKQVRWALYFCQFNFILKYLPAGNNFLAEALSQLSQYDSR
uniref:Reverse transcriptase RNase H-like domain-containing protein n=1 Tax=Micrurus corallinus TaxID=54390 RepID=A0A2D4FI48_MICCO